MLVLLRTETFALAVKWRYPRQWFACDYLNESGLASLQIGPVICEWTVPE